MNSDRLKALTDGVIAVIITIMVLEIKPPASPTPQALLVLAPVMLNYVLSFIYVAIYWNNHHHIFALTPRVSAAIMWANFNLLFWLSLIPFTTAWAGDHHFQPWPTAAYGLVLLACALSWYLMQTVIVAAQGAESQVRRAIGQDWKGKLSPLLYAAGIALAFAWPVGSAAIYAVAALWWCVPDRRLHRAAREQEQHNSAP